MGREVVAHELPSRCLVKIFTRFHIVKDTGSPRSQETQVVAVLTHYGGLALFSLDIGQGEGLGREGEGDAEERG